VDVCLVIKQRLGELGLEQKDLATAAGVTFLNTYNSSELRTMSPMQSFARHNPLTDDEFARLDSFLCKNMKAMNLEQIDGFFTALVCGPEVVMPGEYLPYVWGNEKSQVFDFSGNGSEVRAGLSYGFEVEFTPNRD